MAGYPGLFFLQLHVLAYCIFTRFVPFQFRNCFQSFSHFFCPADAQIAGPDSEERAASRLYEECLLRQALQVMELSHSEPHSKLTLKSLDVLFACLLFLVPRMFFFPSLPYA